MQISGYYSGIESLVLTLGTVGATTIMAYYAGTMVGGSEEGIATPSWFLDGRRKGDLRRRIEPLQGFLRGAMRFSRKIVISLFRVARCNNDRG